MDEKIRRAIVQAVAQEPYALAMGITLKELETGYSVVEMRCRPQQMDNIYQRTHGGAIFGLIDEAFETACQTHGTIAVALNVSVTYVASPQPGVLLRAVARETSRTRRTANYDIRVSDDAGNPIASCQALAYRTGKPIRTLLERPGQRSAPEAPP
jgi:acyl-CoA thioesterase